MLNKNSYYLLLFLLNYKYYKHDNFLVIIEVTTEHKGLTFAVKRCGYWFLGVFFDFLIALILYSFYLIYILN